MGTQFDPVPFADWVAGCPEPGPVAEQKKKAARKAEKHRDELIAAMPWLEHLDYTEGFEQEIKEDKELFGEENPLREDWDHQLSEAAASALDQARAMLAAESLDSAHDDFKTKPLGGDWTMGNVGTYCDAIQAYPSGKVAIAFCKARAGCNSIRFGINAHHGAPICGILARAWAHRMQFFLNAEVDNPRLDGMPFPEALVASYTEPTEFTRLANSKPVKITMDRIRDIRALCV